MPGDTTQAMKRAALDAGFTHVGIAEAGELAREKHLLDAWIDRGYHAGMAWMARDTAKRADPRRLLEGARSVVMLGCSYASGQQHSADPDTGKISRYAWGRDYHRVLKPRLTQVERVIAELVPGSVSRSFVDSGPVMEKAWAARAGVGWIGKHTNLITRDRGSWLFLATVITTAVFESDPPISDYCGTCTACIDACPTAAIVEPYVLDANKCIPYLTIELKEDEIPAADAQDFRGWIFGCDICQDVCPWNRDVEESGEEAFAPRAQTLAPRLAEAAVMTDEAFAAAFAGTPVMRAKAKGFRRNARTLIAQRASDS